MEGILRDSGTGSLEEAVSGCLVKDDSWRTSGEP